MVGARGFEPPTSWTRTMRAKPDCATPRFYTTPIFFYSFFYNSPFLSMLSTHISEVLIISFYYRCIQVYSRYRSYYYRYKH